MPRDLGSQTKLYAAMVKHLPLYDEDIEVTNLFVTRELIDDEVSGGTTHSAEEARRLEEADVALVKLRPLLIRRFRDMFSLRPPDVPRRYWWWYLDEGPQVREQALAVTKEP
ncbi:MAG: hypothetical protein HY689_01070 [Chloroflexi bacterium]|nr:hypothetical protein [Chloroflexota bacterium]